MVSSLQNKLLKPSDVTRNLARFAGKKKNYLATYVIHPLGHTVGLTAAPANLDSLL
jgi:hypothetical protein